MFESMTQGEFSRLSERFQHKKAAEILRTYYEKRTAHTLIVYRRLEHFLGLCPLEIEDFPKLSDRYHLHLSKAQVSWKEHNLLSPWRVCDRPSSFPSLPVFTYLDHLRSAYNVGSIVRTSEAFHFSTLFFSPMTPFVDHPKVQKTSMQTFDKVASQYCDSIEQLPRPLIALETDPLAPSVFEFSFPPSFTLMVGNEEYGLSEQAMAQRDYIVTIPLFGFKNSLNVASAYAIAAGVISHQLRFKQEQTPLI